MTKNKPISPGKKYVLRVLDLAKKDPQIGALMPKESVWEAMAVEGLTIKPSNNFNYESRI